MTSCGPEVTAALCEALSQRIGKPRFGLWFEDKTKFTREDDLLVVGVPNHFYKEWLEKTFAEEVRLTASAMLGEPVQVRFAIDAELFQAARRGEGRHVEVAPEPGVPSSAGYTLEESAVEPAIPAIPGQRRAARSRRWRSLADFVVGPSSRVAHASALSIAEAPGQGANPLVLYGTVGTGKTHLLEGIYAGVRRHAPSWRVLFVSAEEFTNRFVQAMRLGKLAAFRKHFRECDALLLDDLHFLESKPATQEEFLHTFDVLHGESRQLVCTSDCHPRLAEKLLPELADRLLGGAVWGLLPPELETRRDILRAKAARLAHGLLADDVLAFLAEQLRGNVRELEGALHSVVHYGRVAGRRVDLALAREAISDLLRHSVRVVHLDDIERAIGTVLRLERGALQGKERCWSASHPRMLAMYLAREHTRSTYAQIGERFGGRNHSTAVAAEKKVRLWLEKDSRLNLGGREVRVRDLLERMEREIL